MSGLGAAPCLGLARRQGIFYRDPLPVQATGPLESVAPMSSPAFPAPVPASVIPALAARRSGGRVAGRSRLAVGIGSLVAISFLIYAGLCLYMAIKLTTPVRREITRTPDQYGLAYDTVRFPSRDDALDLEGWLVKPAAPDAAPVSAGASSTSLRPLEHLTEVTWPCGGVGAG